MSKQNNSTSHAIYGLGFIGAVIYYISTATSYAGGLLGILKALVWPAILVYEALKALQPAAAPVQDAIVLLTPGFVVLS